MLQSKNEPKQRLIRAAALLLIAMIGLPVMSAQVGPKAPPPEPKTPSRSAGKATRKATRPPVTKPRERPIDWEAPALIELRNSFVPIPAGEFMMGGETSYVDAKPVHRVRINRSFEMGKYEVTQAQWKGVMGSNPSGFKGTNLPVENVSWDDAQQFIQKLNARNDGYLYRLPTEAEWEYACRAGTPTEFAFGNSLSSAQANFDGIIPYGDAPTGRNLGHTVVVGSYEPNAWGLYDMHGNVWEWCHDRYDKDYYAQSPSTDPKGPATGSLRVIRGGGWYGGAGGCLSANRFGTTPGRHDNTIGFRLVRASH